MPIVLRSRKQIDKLRAAGQLVAATYAEIRPHIQPGVTTLELDRMAEEFIRKHDGIPAYKGYKPRFASSPFPGTVCIAVDDVICHGFPTKTRLEEGQIVGIDIGLFLDSWCGDACVTFPVGKVSDEAQRLLTIAEESMWRGIRAAKVAGHMGDIGAAIQGYAESEGCSVVREYGGHGVGQKVHDEPSSVPHHGKPGTGINLRSGLVITIEPMINLGHHGTKIDADGWTVRTVDGSLSAQFEHTIAITENGPEILTAA